MGVGPGWTADRVLAMAPDPASAKAGQGLVSLAKWSNLGQNETLIWGECQGSGKTPYQTKVSLDDQAFSCSCPSRKFPCKHALGLMLIWVNPASKIADTGPPPWVVSWAESRVKKAEAKQQKVEKAAERPDEQLVQAARQKREAAR